MFFSFWVLLVFDKGSSGVLLVFDNGKPWGQPTKARDNPSRLRPKKTREVALDRVGKREINVLWPVNVPLPDFHL